MPNQLTITKDQTKAAFAQWWKDYEADPKSFDERPDLEGKDSADCFFEYVQKAGAK
jgi:hypothetical protein